MKFRVLAVAAAVLLCGCGAVWGQVSPTYNVTQLSASPAASGKSQSRTQNTTSLIMVPEDFSKLILEPGFLLSLEVYDMPEISSELRVDDHGDISLPLVGPVHVAGMTLPIAEETIRKAFVDHQILLAPKIALDVLQYAGFNVTVLGEVQSPGRLQLLSAHTLPEVLAMAGGETQLAGNKVLLSREVNGKTETTTYHYDRNSTTPSDELPAIQPNDSILVPRAGIVYVMGGVSKPGGYLMQQNGTLNVMEALAVAEGTILNAGISGIRVVRTGANGVAQTIPVPFRDITNGKAVPMNLEDGDIVYVPISRTKTILTAGIVAGTSTALIYAIH